MQKEVSTEKKITDYLHLYLGCEIEYEYRFTTQDGSEMRKAQTIGFAENGITHFVELRPIDKHGNISATGTFRKNARDIKPILRPLSDMTKKEINMLVSFNDKIRLPAIYSPMVRESNLYHTTAQDFHYLLSRHFDLFGLIDAGLAIDKTKP